MKTSFKRITQFIQGANGYLKTLKEGEETKLFYAIKKVYKQVGEINEEYQDKVDDADIDFASTDPKTGLLLYRMVDSKKEYERTPEQEKNRVKKLREIYKEEVYEIQPCIVETPSGLPEELKELFNGFVINNEQPAC